MNISFQFVSDVVKNGLTQHEINSFKWGNTLSEEARIKGCIQNLLPHAKWSLRPDATFHKICSKLVQWVNECSDVEALEIMTEKTLGIF